VLGLGFKTVRSKCPVLVKNDRTLSGFKQYLSDFEGSDRMQSRKQKSPETFDSTRVLSSLLWRGIVADLRTFLMTHDLENELESLAKLATIS
jgi:hypothetical protein